MSLNALPDELLLMVLSNVGPEGILNYLIATGDRRAEDNKLWYKIYTDIIGPISYDESVSYYDKYFEISNFLRNYDFWKSQTPNNNTIGHYLIELNLAENYIPIDIYKYLLKQNTPLHDYVIYGILDADDKFRIVYLKYSDLRMVSKGKLPENIESDEIAEIASKLGINVLGASRKILIDEIYNTLLNTGRIFKQKTEPRKRVIRTLQRGRRTNRG